jgi:hypothetical protein
MKNHFGFCPKQPDSPSGGLPGDEIMVLLNIAADEKDAKHAHIYKICECIDQNIPHSNPI